MSVARPIEGIIPIRMSKRVLNVNVKNTLNNIAIKDSKDNIKIGYNTHDKSFNVNCYKYSNFEWQELSLWEGEEDWWINGK